MDFTFLWHALSFVEAMELVTVVEDFVTLLLAYEIIHKKGSPVVRLTLLLQFTLAHND